MTILAIGDSFTAGAELADPAANSWPTLLGQLLNQPVVNQGLVGSSNQRIKRLALNAINQCDLVICAWSDVSRNEVWFQNNMIQLNYNDPTVTTTWPWLKKFIVDHYNYEHAVLSWIIDVLMLQAYFQQRQQPFLFVNAIPKKIPEQAQHLWPQINDITFLDKDDSMQGWCQKCAHGEDKHFLDDGHVVVAERLAQHIIDKSLIRLAV